MLRPASAYARQLGLSRAHQSSHKDAFMHRGTDEVGPYASHNVEQKDLHHPPCTAPRCITLIR